MANLSPIQLIPAVQTSIGEIQNTGPDEGNSGFSEELQGAINLQSMKSEDFSAEAVAQENEVLSALPEDPALQILPLVNWIPSSLPANFASVSASEDTAAVEAAAIGALGRAVSPSADLVGATLQVVPQPLLSMDSAVTASVHSGAFQGPDEARSSDALATALLSESVSGKEAGVDPALVVAPQTNLKPPLEITLQAPSPGAERLHASAGLGMTRLESAADTRSLPNVSSVKWDTSAEKDVPVITDTLSALQDVDRVLKVDSDAITEKRDVVTANGEDPVAHVAPLAQTSQEEAPTTVPRSDLSMSAAQSDITTNVSKLGSSAPIDAVNGYSNETIRSLNADAGIPKVSSHSTLPLEQLVPSEVVKAEKTPQGMTSNEESTPVVSSDTPIAVEKMAITADDSLGQRTSTQGFQTSFKTSEAVQKDITLVVPAFSFQASPEGRPDNPSGEVSALAALAPLEEGDVSGLKASIDNAAQRAEGVLSKPEAKNLSAQPMSDKVVGSTVLTPPMTSEASPASRNDRDDTLVAATAVSTLEREVDTATSSSPPTTFLSTLIGQPAISHNAKEVTWLQSSPVLHPMEPHDVKLDSGQVQVEILRMVKQGGGQVVMELTPPDQSKFRIDLQIDAQGQATLVVEGASDSTRTRLEQGASGLQQQFAEMGLQLQLDMRQSRDFGDRQNAAQWAHQQGGSAQTAKADAAQRAEALSAQKALRREAAEGNVHLYA